MAKNKTCGFQLAGKNTSNLKVSNDQNPLKYWYNRRASYSLLAPIAEDLLSAPASQAYVERIFSVCGWLTAGRRNRLTKNLEMRVFMKLNNNIVY